MPNSERFNEGPAMPAFALDVPYPLEDLSRSSPDTPVEKQNNLDFFLQATGQDDEQKLKDHARKIQEEAYGIYSYPCIRSWAFMT